MGRPIDQSARVAAARYGELVNAVYDMFMLNKTDLQPPASPAFAPNWKLLAWIDMKDFILGFTDPRFYGVVLQSADPAATDGFEYAIAIRGTEGPLEWIDDAMALPVPFSAVPDAGHVAFGFNHIYQTLNVIHVETGARPQLAAKTVPQTFAQQIDALVRMSQSGRMRTLADTGEPQGRFLVVAHSLGAALATLYVIENLTLKTVQVDTLCTFASPLVGWAHFVQRFNQLQTNGLTSWRFANTNDLVTKVPFKLLGYRHVDVGYEFNGARIAKHNLSCMHNMKTYQAELDAQNFHVPGGCEIPVQPFERIAMTALSPQPEISEGGVMATAASVPLRIKATIEIDLPLPIDG